LEGLRSITPHLGTLSGLTGAKQAIYNYKIIWNRQNPLSPFIITPEEQLELTELNTTRKKKGKRIAHEYTTILFNGERRLND
jgi:hypothetical protein